MDKRDKGYTLYKKGLSCTEISKKLDVSINTVKSWRKRYWTQGADAPAKRTLHPEDAPTAPDPETRPKQGARRVMSMPLEQVRPRVTETPSSMAGGLN